MSALSWNEIRDRAIQFSKEWEDESSESAEAKSFWDDFFHIFGISRRRVATFEKPVKKLDNKQGFIDLLWKGEIMVEHKSRGRDLDKAFTQAKDYFPGLKENELPRYILVSDFARFRLHDLEEDEEHDFELKDLYKHVKLFGFIAGYQKRSYKEQDPVNIKAAEQMGLLHDKLKEVGYEGHALEVYLVRLLFCMFADDTTIFEKDTFLQYLEEKTHEDGSDLAMHMANIFQVLNTPREKRLKNLDEHLNQFPYVNGKLFEEPLPLAAFDTKMRQILIDACYLDWGKISPAIFGSLFQSVMNPQERRNLGAHYTSEKNILKLIKPLFLDELWEEFEKVKHNRKKLTQFHNKVADLTFFDPACGCGNFLVITYRELRLLELAILRHQNQSGQGFLDISSIVKLDITSFYGIEIDEWAARIAEVAMWLMDHQMNMAVSEEFGQYFNRLPLVSSANIVHENALQIDWEDVVSKKILGYIIGNPPFIGHQWRTKEQMGDMALIWGNSKRSKRLDYVTCWFFKAALLIKGTKIKAAFVSTNSIAQGEQPAILWGELFKEEMKIDFAYRTFIWQSESKGKAQVHVVIIGYSDERNDWPKYIYEHDNEDQDHIVSYKSENINGYLFNGPSIFIESRGKPLHTFSKMFKGSQPTDGGNLILSVEEKNELSSQFPESQKWVRPFMGAREFLQNKKRFCLWLKSVNPSIIKNIPPILDRLEKVKEFRLTSATASVRDYSQFPTLFTQDRQPNSEYLAVPKVSSERRIYLPIGFLSENVICSDLLNVIPNANLFLFGMLQSSMHNVWLRYFCGRLKSDFRYSSAVYNNFPFPKFSNDNLKITLEKKAQAVLDARALYPDSSLADLYDPLTMPPELVKAHQALDKAVDKCYRSQPFPNERKRIEFLFELYAEYTEPLLGGNG